MMLHIPDVLTPEQVIAIRARLDASGWEDGRATVGAQGALVKRNRQLPELSELGIELGRYVQRAVAANPLFFAAALPARTMLPLFNCYEGGEHYGSHVDGSVRKVPGADYQLRTDVSTTLFLSDPTRTAAGTRRCHRGPRPRPGGGTLWSPPAG